MPSGRSSRSRSTRPSQGSRSRSTRTNGRSRSTRTKSTSSSRPICPNRCNPLNLFTCVFGGPTIQTVLLSLLPIIIATMLFLAGVWKISFWVYEVGQRKYKIAAQGYSVDGTDAGLHKPLYTNDWPEPIHSIPLLLLLHLILGVLITTNLVYLLFSGLSIARHRRSDVSIREAWNVATRNPPWYSSVLTTVLILATGALLAFDNAVWGITKQKKKLELHPDILGYFVCIGAFLLWALWLCIHLVTLNDRPKKKKYYVTGGTTEWH